MSTSTFWIEDIKQLFSTKSGFFPHSGQTLAESMNAISRLALLACLIILFYKPVLGISTVVITMVVIISIYYAQSSKEGYDSISHCEPLLPPPRNNRVIPDDPADYVSENQMLLGGPNPKTRIPINNALKSRIYDTESWKTKGYCSECSRTPCICMQLTFAKQKLERKHTKVVDDEDVENLPEIIDISYISRNNVNILPQFNTGLNDVKQNALDRYRDSTNNARMGFQESLMRKRNKELAQMRYGN